MAKGAALVGFSRTSRVVYLGLAVGLALGLHVFEAMIPMPTDFVVPGFKLGLANIVSLYVILNLGIKDAVMVSVLRTALGSLASGFTVTFFFSFFGGLISTIVMGMLHRYVSKHFSLMGISLAGAVTHNVVQLAVASIIIRSAGIFAALPQMLFFAVPTGAFVGLITRQVHRHFSVQNR